MEYGICNLAVIPLRAEANERSEQISQVLFGEAFVIIEYTENWVKITTAFDNYTGWIARLQFITIDQATFLLLNHTTPRLTCQPVTIARKLADGSLLYLPAGSAMPFLNGDICLIGNDQFETTAPLAPKREALAKTAVSFLNSPYLWGGRTHFGIDCSGFTQAVFKLQGIRLLRDASLQVEQGKPVISINESRPGDLAFFDNADGRVVHVGILLGSQKIIHASGKVKIDIIDGKGIYSEELKRYTHKLKIIKRVL